MYFFSSVLPTESVDAAILSAMFYQYLFPCLPSSLEGVLC